MTLGGFACQGPIANRPQDTILPHTAAGDRSSSRTAPFWSRLCEEPILSRGQSERNRRGFWRVSAPRLY